MVISQSRPRLTEEGRMGALRDKYNYAIQTAKDVRMQGSADERDGKLYFHGTVNTQAEANKIWDAIKTVPDWSKDVVADIKADTRSEERRVGKESRSRWA